ncbi:MAG TPA: Gfo/Idh/MocA family oxidoreductase [Candidatus Dormibacteraeota bacterium]|nr:Gfo/Idh/MocA family oxidoreductase [Candidatus Dormibacteraeota bacterium]
MTPRRVAIVGTGGIARQHVSAVQAQGDRARLVAAVDVDAGQLQAFCAEFGIEASYTAARQMLDREHPDLVCIATPPATHADLSVLCLEHGAWVLCEKPLCASLAELDRIQAAERATGHRCASVFQWRFGSAGRHLKSLIDRGELGRPLVGLCQTTWYRNQAYYEKAWRGRWDNEIGGASMGHGIHAMDLFLWLMGDWREVSAMLGTLDRRIQVEDASVAVVRFANGALGTIVNSVLSPHEETYLRFDLQRASVEVRALYHYTNAHWTFTPAPDAGAAPWQVPADEASSHRAQLAALLDSMDHDAAPPAGTAGVRPTFEFLSSLYRSAAEGRAIRRGEIQPGDPFYDHVAGTLASESAVP